ncbi:hypothetical protein AAG570_012118 [Ranatra chinensis]|uniref:Uncharacterized protein n=1 Tax=Ranatra chinensis TaxID=642074 RepID=A0ABD0YI18_9HEMI
MDVSSSWEDAKWWSGACEEDTTLSLELDGENGAWARGFLPPPPRPMYLEKEAQSDGLTTCDLCTWATATHSTHQTSIAALPWSITLVIVSMVSALIGATLMVTLRHCMSLGLSDGSARNAENADVDKEVEEREESRINEGRRSRGLWCWIRRHPSGPSLRSDVITASNHYTVDEAYSGTVGEALYAELDKPVYQNTGYVLDTDTASPPSSAYYSDLSDRTYESVGQQWEMAQVPLSRQRLSAIAENSPIHSDYV